MNKHSASSKVFNDITHTLMRRNVYALLADKLLKCARANTNTKEQGLENRRPLAWK